MQKDLSKLRTRIYRFAVLLLLLPVSSPHSSDDSRVGYEDYSSDVYSLDQEYLSVLMIVLMIAESATRLIVLMYLV